MASSSERQPREQIDENEEEIRRREEAFGTFPTTYQDMESSRERRLKRGRRSKDGRYSEDSSGASSSSSPAPPSDPSIGFRRSGDPIAKRHPVSLQARERILSFRFLQSVLNKDPERIVFILMKERSSFVELLEENLSNDSIVVIVKILRKISTVSFIHTKGIVLRTALNNKFLMTVRKFLSAVPLHSARDRAISRWFWDDPSNFLMDLCETCDSVLTSTSTFGNKVSTKILNSINIYMPFFDERKNFVVSSEILDEVWRMLDVIQDMFIDNQSEEQVANPAAILDRPSDFRQINVYPAAAEVIITEKITPHENVCNQIYESVESYLDDHFRLYRKDFFEPLRQAISKCRYDLHQTDNIEFYTNVRFLHTETINEHYCFRVTMGLNIGEPVDLVDPKRFLYGALLCFTNDYFQSMIFGKVAKRKIEDLEKRQVIVAFETEVEVQFDLDYFMLEYNVHFEPYYHVLTILKSLNNDNFPMERYLIHRNPQIKPPSYLNDTLSVFNIEGHQFHPLSDWPYANLYSFNKPQMAAFKAALTQEFSIIQGPPGTGKSYLGLKIVETLIKNKTRWYQGSPVLIISLTDHTVDRFLQELAFYTKDIIRVRHKSQNVKLEFFRWSHHAQRDGFIVERKIALQSFLRNIQRDTEILKQIDYFDKVFSFHIFDKSIPHFSSTWFYTANRKDVLDWLLEEIESKPVTLRNDFNLIQVQDEFGKIDVNDITTEDENAADMPTASDGDEIFYQIQLNPDGILIRNFFLISVERLERELNHAEEKLAQLKEVEIPTLQQILDIDQLSWQIRMQRLKYEYVRVQLARGELMGASVKRPRKIDLLNPYRMSFNDRWNLYFYVLNRYKQRKREKLAQLTKDFKKQYKIYEEMKEIANVTIMKSALVVGMTISSAIKLRPSLESFQNPIVIVDEASEIPEAQIVASITKDCRHLILIGDNKQYKPTEQTTEYSQPNEDHNHEMNLFERMSSKNIYCSTLDVQHRMRPEIASLIRPSVYPVLEDHRSVLRRPPIPGMNNVLFFIEHQHPESNVTNDESTTTNLYEVKFLIYLARHLVLNGNNPENITILTVHLGQFHAFNQEKLSHKYLLRDVRVAVLDHYQGEESDIILLSLVRNNSEKKIGCLKNKNLMSVALSRAKYGLYIMGNMDQLCDNNQFWREVKDSLKEQNAIGSKLKLRCQNHPNVITQIQSGGDFHFVPGGGCPKMCNAELPCGHKCASHCHVIDKNHVTYRCNSECNKKICNKDETHVCKKKCFENCDRCSILVPRILACGHEVTIECHINPDTFKCSISVETVLPCGHKIGKPCCDDPTTFVCPHICGAKLERCGHSCELPCHVHHDPHHLEYKCQKPCSKFRKYCTTREDSHLCPNKCCEPCEHCNIIVKKERTICPHVFDVPCKFDVDKMECEQPCVVNLRCGHKCYNKCDEPCSLCHRKVTKKSPCGHSIRIRCCYQPNRILCNKKCLLKLPCGHACVAKCNEPCIEECKVMVNMPGITAECGHVVSKTECHLIAKAADPKLLVKFCNQPCGVELKCGHLCSGNCSECFQGRIHKRCQENCGTTLVCDHQCDSPCFQACPPCNRMCFYKCQHSNCSQACGEVCTPCRKRCPRRCIHQICSRYCSDICSVSPCNEPCHKYLDCGHPCIGFCGDPCPPKCLVCDRAELTKIFFGTEGDDVRYVLLNDCNHVVENIGMEHWLELYENQIGYKPCPICKTPIKTTHRYSDYYKQALIDINEVKTKTIGTPLEIEEQREGILKTMRELYVNYRALITYCPDVNTLLTRVQQRLEASKKGRGTPITKHELHVFEAKLQIFDHMMQVCKKGILHESQEIFMPQISFIINTLLRDLGSISGQEIDDIRSEINRLARIVEYDCICKALLFTLNDDTVTNLLDKTKKLCFSFKKFTTEDDDKLTELLNALNNFMPIAVIDISEREESDIVPAMVYTKEHWFKCPIGHIYATEQCVGPLEEATCNECGAKIGEFHRALRQLNAAVEIGEVREVLWAEALRKINNQFRHH